MSSSLIRCARDAEGVSIRALASRLDVSPSAVVGWESAEERGVIQMGTLERALKALGHHLEVGTAPMAATLRATTREERVSMELHRAVVVKLMTEPDVVLGLVASNVEKMRQYVRGDQPNAWLERWKRLAEERDIAGLVQVMLDPSQDGVDMRQCTPFAGALRQRERVAAIQKASPDGH